MTHTAEFGWLASRSTRNIDGCLVWGGTLQPNGYGRITIPNFHKRDYVHRLAYKLEVGPLVKGLEIDHICHDVRTCTPPCTHRACIEPSHLRQVTHRENTSRSFKLVDGRLTCIRRGHDLALKNSIITRGSLESPTCAECWKLSRNRFSVRTAKGLSVPYWQIKRNCEVCGAEFIPKKKHTRSCSRAHASQLMWKVRKSRNLEKGR